MEIHAVTAANFPYHQIKERETDQSFLSVQYLKLHLLQPLQDSSLYFTHRHRHVLSRRQNYSKHLYFLILLGDGGACGDAEVAEENEVALNLILPWPPTWSRLKVHQRPSTLSSALQGLLRSHQTCRIPKKTNGQTNELRRSCRTKGQVGRREEGNSCFFRVDIY